MTRAAALLIVTMAGCRGGAKTTDSTATSTAAAPAAPAETARAASSGSPEDPARVMVMDVRYRLTHAQFLESHAQLVSARGIYLSSQKQVYPAGTLIKFAIALDDERAAIAGIGRIAWTGAPGDPLPGMGIKFIQVTPRTKEFLVELVAQRRAQKQPAKYELGFAEGQRLTSTAQEDQILANLATKAGPP